MKNQRSKEKQSSIITKVYQRKKVWKITAVAVIVLFVLLMIAGLIKVYYFRSFLIKPTQVQIDYATKIATEKLKSMGENASSFQTHVGKRIKRFRSDGIAKSIMEVSFYKDSTSHAYLIDVNSGEVLLHSETNTYGAWMNQKAYNRHESMHSSGDRKRLEQIYPNLEK